MGESELHPAYELGPQRAKEATFSPLFVLTERGASAEKGPRVAIN